MIYRKNKSSGKFRITKQNAAIERKNHRNSDKSASFPYLHTLNKNNNLKRKHYGNYQKRHPRRCLRESRNNSRWKSSYYIRAHAAKVSNPRTPKQQEQRGKFATVFGFLKTIKPFIRIGYKEFTEEKSAYNAAMSYMLKKVVINSEKEITIDFNRVLVSTGSLMPVFEGTATASEGKIFFNWKDNSGMGNAEDTDITMVLAYNKDKGKAVYDTEAGSRQDEAAELMIPDEWQDDELIAYLSFRSADGSSVANSVRMTILS